VPREDFKHPDDPLDAALAPSARRRSIDFMFGMNPAEVAVLLGIIGASALGLPHRQAGSSAGV
jgi:hypothetical protein